MVRHLNLTLAISTFVRVFNFFSYEISYDDIKFAKISEIIFLHFIIFFYFYSLNHFIMGL